MGYRIGIDVGGTFTDLALCDAEGKTLRLSKVLTTPDDPSIAVLEGTDELLREAGLHASALAEASHATTIATNTVIQRKGPATALLTTEGFRDVLIIGRQKRWELYDNAIDKPAPVVRRRAIWEVRERLLHDGSVRIPLDEEGVRVAARAMLDDGVRAVAVCFLHSYVNPAHERRAGEIIAETAPDLMVTLSSDVSPIYREYERASTTALNAYVMPPVAAYIARLERGLRERGYRQQLYIMQSNGGLATPEVATRFPIRILESGPAAGVLAAANYVEAAGTGNLISFDMGGTTAKVCLIEDGQPAVTGQFEFDMVNLKRNSGLPISIPAIELVEVGSGGGSLARVEMGAIVVGPESSGSKPGPMCYGLGGSRPTVTDADLVLGYLNPDYFLGGQMKLDSDAARRGIQTEVAGPLGLEVEVAAWGIHEVVTAQMAQAARVVSIGRGKDPRDFVLVPFGGAGPVHGARLALMLGARRVVFPVGAGVASAIGLLMADPAFDLVRTSMFGLEAGALEQVNALYAELEGQAAEQLRSGALSGVGRNERSCDMRFAGQGYEINVPLPDGPYRVEDLPGLHEAFFSTYASTYGDRAFNRADPVVGVHWRLRAVVKREPLHFGEVGRGDGRGTDAYKGTRAVYFPETGGLTECPIYERSRLGAGDRVQGPAIIEERESTIVLIPASAASVDGQGNVIVTIAS